MKQRKNYPKTAKAIAGFALFLFVLGFKATPFFLLAAFFGLIALILALGPDNDAVVAYGYDPSPMNSDQIIPLRRPL